MEKLKFLINQKQVRLLLSLNNGGKEKCAMRLCRHNDVTFSHGTRVLANFSDYGLTNKIREGRSTYYKLTPKGKEVVNLFLKINEVMGIKND